MALIRILSDHGELLPNTLLMIGNPTPNGDAYELKSSGSSEDAMGVYLGNSLIAGDGIVTVHGMFVCPTLPTADPGLPGAMWNDQGTVKISQG